MKKLKCCGCKLRYPADTMTKHPAGNFCTDECAVSYAQAKSKKLRERAAVKKIKDEKKQDHANRKKLRESSKKWMMNKTKELCHKYIRARDTVLPCISCGLYQCEIDTAGWDHIWDAGHYLSRGSHPELRFEELNIHKQCVKCNTAPNLSGQSRSVREGYRESLIRKIGIDKVEWLEGPHPIPKRTLDSLRDIQRFYKLKIKELES